MSFEKLTQTGSLFSTQDVISCVRDTEASSAYIFQRRIHTCKTSGNSNNREIIQRILMVSNYL
jgi:hypothetical protein